MSGPFLKRNVNCSFFSCCFIVIFFPFLTIFATALYFCSRHETEASSAAFQGRQVSSGGRGRGVHPPNPTPPRELQNEHGRK